MSAKPRACRPLWHFDPYAERPPRTQLELDAAFKALWEMAEDDEYLMYTAA